MPLFEMSTPFDPLFVQVQFRLRRADVDFRRKLRVRCDVTELEHLMEVRLKKRVEEDATEERTGLHRWGHARHFLLNGSATELETSSKADDAGVTSLQDAHRQASVVFEFSL